MASLSRRQVVNATTSSPWTRDFRHMLPFPRNWLVRRNRSDPHVKAVPVRDRIKYWNIVPGDQIRVRGEPTGKIHEVLSINKMSNRVFLKGVRTEGEDKTPPGQLPPTKNVHYSRCQLFIGNYAFPSRKKDGDIVQRPVFSLRLGTNKPYWKKNTRHYLWDRIVVATSPPLPQHEDRSQTIIIPWPKKEPLDPPPPSFYHTDRATVAEVTYMPPPLLSAKSPLPEERLYLSTIYDPQSTEPFNDAVEVHLYKELSNPHSRAKKQARWQQYKIRTQNMLKQYIDAEVQSLDGRTVREAKAEAAFKWRQQVAADKEAERKRRWKNKDNVARMERKKMRRYKKEGSKRRALEGLVLKDEPNQVVPR